MISSSSWVPRGYASEFPEKYELNEEEMERITSMAKLQLSEKAPRSLKDDIEIDDDLKEYDLEHYDDEDSDGEDITMLPGLTGTDAKYHEGEDGEDPYLSLPAEEDVQLDRQELQIYPSDNLVLATRTEDDVSYLDVYVYDDGAGNIDLDDKEDDNPDVVKGYMRESSLYVHHDIMLPAFPLCVEWINYKPNSTNDLGNFAAIGTFDPQIEVWNLDAVDKAFPDLILGEVETVSGTKLKKSKKKKSKSHNLTHHVDAVLSLSHNKLHRNVLTSTSADSTVKIWDLNNGVAVRSFNEIHNQKTVSSAQWHLTEDSILLTGGYDSSVGITDVRISDEQEMTKKYTVGTSNEDIEIVKWGNKPEIFHCGTDQGNIYTYDIRNPGVPLWILHAHDAGISGLDINYNLNGMMVTSAMGDKEVKIWKFSEDKPSMVLSRDFDVGNVLTCSISGDIEIGGHIVIGGASGGLKVWDSFNNKSIRSSFKQELNALQKRAKEEASSIGKFSRISNKYKDETVVDNVMAVDEGSDDDESDNNDE